MPTQANLILGVGESSSFIKTLLTFVTDMFGVGNFDVFRWPSIRNGTEKQNLGTYIISLLFPGIPLINWGEEQAFYILENTNANYGKEPTTAPSDIAY